MYLANILYGLIFFPAQNWTRGKKKLLQKKSAWGKTEKQNKQTKKTKGIFKEHLQFWYYNWRRNTEKRIRRFGLPDHGGLNSQATREQLV